MTVAICTRGREAQLRRALGSLHAQRRPPEEILVVDNGAEDPATRRMVTTEFPRVRYVEEKIPGLDFSRNRALHEASYPLVAFLDDDAVAEAGWTEAIADTFTRVPGAGVVTGRVEALALETPAQRLFEANGGFARGREPITLPEDRATRRLHGHRRAPLIAWAVSIGSGCSLAVRRDLALSLGGFDEALDLGTALPGGGDHDMLWRVLMAGRSVVYQPAALARHEHRRELEAATAQIIGHQRALVAFLTKLWRTSGGRMRAEIGLYLLWRLLKPGARLLRRLVGREPLPVRTLGRLWAGCWLGLVAYPRAQRIAAERRASCTE